MLHYWSLQDVHLQDVWLTIGSFDGVHKGHQAIIRQLTAGAQAAGVPAVVLTFHPHPAVVLRGLQGPYYLTNPEERAALLTQIGVDVVITHPFNHQVAGLSAYDFVASLHRHLGMRKLCVGHDFALGRGREGDLPTLERFGAEFGYRLMAMEPVRLEGQVVSSSQVRAALQNGDVEKAEHLLGRPYHVSGEVVPGDGRGHKLGIPTANLDVWAGRVLPKAGVYACLAQIDGQTWRAVVNVGLRPTFGDLPSLRVEAHILGFEADLYGRQVSLSFFAHLRDERRFPNVDALVTQIQHDIDQARRMLDQP